MASKYPAELDSLATNKADATTTETDHKNHHNDLADAVNKIEAELGVTPSEAHSTVAAATKAQMGRWIPIFDGWVNLSASEVGTYVCHRAVTEDLLIGAATPATAASAFMHLDPAAYEIAGYTLKYRLIASFVQNATANKGTSVATAGLYALTGGSTTTSWTETLGTVIEGSTAAKTGGEASKKTTVVSSTFTAPASDAYAMAVVISAAKTEGFTRINTRLEYSYA